MSQITVIYLLILVKMIFYTFYYSIHVKINIVKLLFYTKLPILSRDYEMWNNFKKNLVYENLLCKLKSELSKFKSILNSYDKLMNHFNCLHCF